MSKAATDEKHVEAVEETRGGGTPEGWEAVQAEPDSSKGEAEEAERKSPEIKEPTVDDKRPGILAGTLSDGKKADERPKVVSATTQSSEKKRPNAPVNTKAVEKTRDEPEISSPVTQHPERTKPNSPVDPVGGGKVQFPTPKISRRQVHPSVADTPSGNKV